MPFTAPDSDVIDAPPVKIGGFVAPASDAIDLGASPVASSSTAPSLQPLTPEQLRQSDIQQPSQLSGGQSQNAPSADNPDWQFTLATHGNPVTAIADELTQKIGAAALKAEAPMWARDSIEPGKPVVLTPGIEKYSEQKGVGPALTRAALGLETPGALVTLPFAGFKPVQALIAAQGVTSIPDAIGEMTQAKTPEEVRDAATGLGLNVAMAYLGRRGFSEPTAGIKTRPESQPEAVAKPLTTIGEETGGVLDKLRLPSQEQAVSETQPTKPLKSETQITPDRLQPALMVDNKPVTGGNTHAEILNNIRDKATETKDPDAVDQFSKTLDAFQDDSKHVFVDDSGRVYSRTEAATALGQEKPLHSQDLNELKGRPVNEGALGDVGMGGAKRTELDQRTDENQTAGYGGDIYGVAARVRAERAKAGQVVPVPSGEGVSPIESVEWGRELLKRGIDPEKLMQEAEKTGATSYDAAAVFRAQGEKLFQEARKAEEQFGTDSPEWKAAQEKASAWDLRSKPVVATLWQKIGMTLQGETDLDTGSFTGIQRAFKNATGKDFTPQQKGTAEKLVSGVKQAQGEMEQTKQKLLGQLETELGAEAQPEPVEPHVRMIANRLKDYLDKRAKSAFERIQQRRKEGRLFTGIDPTELIDYADYGASKILAKGIEAEKMTEDWAREMVQELGEVIKPHLETIWNAAKKSFGAGYKKFVEPKDSEKVKRAITRRPESGKSAEDEAMQAVFERHQQIATDAAKAEEKARLAQQELEQARKAVQETAKSEALKKANEVVRANATRLAKESAQPVNRPNVGKVQETAAAKAQGAASKATRDAATEKSKSESAERVRQAQLKLDRAKVEAKAAKESQEASDKRVRQMAVDAAKKEAKNRAARADKAKFLWNLAKEYINEGADDFDGIIQKISIETGMPMAEVRYQLTRSKSLKKATDEMYRKQSDLRRLKSQAASWLKDQQYPGWYRLMRKIPRAFFIDKVFGHGTVGMITHAGLNIFNPTAWKTYFPNFFRQFGFLFNRAYHERAMQDLTRDPLFNKAKRAGLANDPRHFQDDYQNAWYGRFFTRLGMSGNRGFDALKTFRQARFNQIWNRLPKSLQTDNMAKLIADAVNHSTGVVKTTLPGALQDAATWTFFAPKLEMSRWAWMLKDPAKASRIFAQWRTATPEERSFAISQVKEKALIAATYYALLKMNQGMLSAMGSNQQINFNNPRRSDFLSFKVAGHNVGVVGPMLGMVRLFANLYHDATAKRTPFEQLHSRWDEEKDTLGDYARGKFSPFASFAADVASQSDFTQRPMPFSTEKVPSFLSKRGVTPYTWKEYAETKFAPITIEDAVREVWADEGMNKGEMEAYLNALMVGLSAFTGARVSPDYHENK